MEYANLLQAYAETAKEDLVIVMRVYFEKLVQVSFNGLCISVTEKKI